MQSRWRFRRLVLAVLLAAMGMIGRSQAQTSDADALARRLADLEAQVFELRRSSVASPPQAGWTLPNGYESVDPVNHTLIPPSPTPFLESEFSQAAPAKPAPEKPKYPTVQVNGAIQMDAVYFNQDQRSQALNGDIQDGADFRRFRMSASGAVAPNVNYFAQIDFAFIGRPTFTDIWGEVTKVPILGNVRFGQWKQPFALETVTSFRYQTFMERSVLFTSFEAFRHLGIGFYNYNEEETSTWAMSVFRQGQNQYGADLGDSGGAASAGRITWLPYYDKQGDYLHYFHTGAAYYIGDPANNLIRYATIPEIFVGAFASSPANPVGTSKIPLTNVLNGTPPFADTGSFKIHMFSNIGTEFLWVNGPASIQSEVQMSTASQVGGPQVTFWGFYTYGSVFLTGESRPYNRKAGALDRVVPLRPFIAEPGCCYGPGAWEMALRWSFLDLDSHNINGGQLTDVTAGVNWYLNGYAKVQFNYIRAMQQPFNAQRASTDIFGVRAQVDW